jgi:prepilin signal peptidase PulO-like enzyme (type II secretory pathway)
LSALLLVVLGALFFAAAATVGVLIAASMTFDTSDLENQPPKGEPPIPLLILAAGCIGAIVAPHAAGGAQIVVLALVCLALAGVWCTDVRFGIVPDVFTLTPLALLLIVAVVQHQWGMVLAAFLPALPFAGAAVLSRGVGMGWGDVKLAALGGAVLGAQTAVLAFALACVAAVIVAYARGLRKRPIAFAPYLACAIAAAIPIAVLA